MCGWRRVLWPPVSYRRWVLRQALARLLTKAGYDEVTSDTVEAVETIMQRVSPDALLVAVRLGACNGLQLLAPIELPTRSQPTADRPPVGPIRTNRSKTCWILAHRSTPTTKRNKDPSAFNARISGVSVSQAPPLVFGRPTRRDRA